MNPNLNMDWINNPNLTESDLNRISESFGYDTLIGANNGEEVRRANSTIKWKNDQEINSIEPEDDKKPEPTPIPDTSNSGKLIFYIPDNEIGKEATFKINNDFIKKIYQRNFYIAQTIDNQTNTITEDDMDYSNGGTYKTTLIQEYNSSASTQLVCVCGENYWDFNYSYSECIGDTNNNINFYIPNCEAWSEITLF